MSEISFCPKDKGKSGGISVLDKCGDWFGNPILCLGQYLLYVAHFGQEVNNRRRSSMNRRSVFSKLLVAFLSIVLLLSSATDTLAYPGYPKVIGFPWVGSAPIGTPQRRKGQDVWVPADAQPIRGVRIPLFTTDYYGGGSVGSVRVAIYALGAHRFFPVGDPIIVSDWQSENLVQHGDYPEQGWRWHWFNFPGLFQNHPSDWYGLVVESTVIDGTNYRTFWGLTQDTVYNTSLYEYAGQWYFFYGMDFIFEMYPSFTINYDLNYDCQVDIVDIMVVAGHVGGVYDIYYDLDLDGDIDVNDVNLVVAHWGERCVPPR